MRIRPIKSPIINSGDDLLAILSEVLPPLEERSVVVITSKVVALAERAVVAKEGLDKHQLAREEAEYFTDPNDSEFHVMLTVKDHILAVNAGIDESNVKDHYVLLPKDSYASAERIWQWLRQQYGLKEVGVLITDSTSLPLKWGTVGRALAHCGFSALKSLIGTEDLHGRKMVMTKMNIAEGLASAAVLEMGEGAEATPFAVVDGITHITFQDQPLTQQERAELAIELKDDVYYPLLKVFER